MAPGHTSTRPRARAVTVNRFLWLVIVFRQPRADFRLAMMNHDACRVTIMMPAHVLSGPSTVKPTASALARRYG